MAPTTIRKPSTRPARPAARYWKGKVPKGVADVLSESEPDEDEVPEEEQDAGDVPIAIVDGTEGKEEEDEEEGDSGFLAGKPAAVGGAKETSLVLNLSRREKPTEVEEEGASVLRISRLFF
jgi:microfibrillar-associated protein 1